ncbi:MAG: PstS family phosphate ABC transporter substrate-binding protein [Planctomycetaceae bacterium]
MSGITRRCLCLGLLGFVGLAGCTVETASTTESGSGAGGATQSSQINIDGSSTVAPISMAIAEGFGDAHPDVIPKVNVSGTGGGFEAFSRGDIDISNASRPIKSSEAEACEKNGVKYIELMVATDGLTVVVNPENDWCTALTVEQLVQIWSKDSQVNLWSDINPEWPAEKIKLFAPDTKSGTYDYFKEETVGKDGAIRTDYQPNTDDNVLVTGISGDKYSLGFFGYAYYVAAKGEVKGVAIAPKGADAAAAVLPTQETIENGTYTPLSRPLFIYPNLESLKRPEVAEFVQYHLSPEGQALVELKKYVKLNPEQLAASQAVLADALKAE